MRALQTSMIHPYLDLKFRNGHFNELLFANSLQSVLLCRGFVPFTRTTADLQNYCRKQFRCKIVLSVKRMQINFD